MGFVRSALSPLVISVGIVIGLLIIVCFMAAFLRKRKSSSYSSGSGCAHTGSKTAEKKSSEMPKMKAALGTKWGSGHHCQARCIKCDQPIVIQLPEGPIRGQRAQIVNKHECPNCGQSLYATTCTTGRAVLAADCSIVYEQMQFLNPVELKFDDDDAVTFGGNKLFPLPLVVVKGKDGKNALLSL